MMFLSRLLLASLIPSLHVMATSQCITHEQAMLSQPRVFHAAASWSSPGGDSGIAMFAGGARGNSDWTNTVDVYQKIGQGIPGTWWNTTISQARQDLVGTSNMDRIFFAGGQTNGVPSAVVDIFDVPTRSWTTDSLSVPRSSVAAASVGPYTLFIGGQGPSGWSNVVDIYNGNTGDWLPTQFLSTTPNFVSATTCGTWVMITGYNPTSSTNQVWFFNSATAQVLQSSSVSLNARINYGSATANNNIFIGGGVNGNQIMSTVDLWKCTSTTATPQFSGATTMSFQQAHSYGITTVLNKYVVIGGGFTNPPAPALSAQVTAFNVNSNAWTRSIPPMVTPRASPIAATAGNTVLFTGGTDGATAFYNTVDIYTFAC